VLELFFRKKTKPFFLSIAQLIGRQISANALTICAFVCGLLCGVCIALHLKILALLFLCLSGLFDVLDGAVARVTNSATELGAFSDLVSDRMVESAIMAGIAWGYPDYAFVCLLFMIALLLHFSTFGIAASLFKNKSEKSFHYNKSFVERLDVFIVFAIIIAMPSITIPVLMVLNSFMFIDGAMRFKAVIS